jgi:hypothetical protein
VIPGEGAVSFKTVWFFSHKYFPEAEGKISTNPPLMELFPQISVNISVYTFIEQEGSLLKFHNAQKTIR